MLVVGGDQGLVLGDSGLYGLAELIILAVKKLLISIKLAEQPIGFIHILVGLVRHFVLSLG